MAPGDLVSLDAYLAGPSAPGSYELALDVEQIEGARFDGPGNVLLRLRVPVVARAAED